jgi:hypothetical protein
MKSTPNYYVDKCRYVLRYKVNVANMVRKLAVHIFKTYFTLKMIFILLSIITNYIFGVSDPFREHTSVRNHVHNCVKGSPVVRGRSRNKHGSHRRC